MKTGGKRKNVREFLFSCGRNYASLVPFWRYCELIVESLKFLILHVYVALPLGVTPLKFLQDLLCRKFRVSGLSSVVVCIVLCFAVFVEFRLVSDDGQTDVQTDSRDYNIYCVSIASHC